MRFAIATDDESQIAAHTGRCRGFVVYDALDGTASRVEFRANDGTAHARGECTEGSHSPADSAHHSHEPLLDALADCKALVTRGMGFRLVTDLRSRGITPFVCAAQSVGEAAALFAKGQLPQGPGAGTCRHPQDHN
ncbi:MAG: NifB/NifX family molybdenum-iron cluster-binding protein [Phycisphaerae bacterium]|jgi:predicted Fe-Mo cluster-binding NifX family protein